MPAYSNIFLVIFGGLGLYIIFRGGLFIFTAYQKDQWLKSGQNWPIVTGTISKSKVKTAVGDNGALYTPTITIRYSAGGTEFTRKAELRETSSSQNAADVSKQISTGKNITVHYNPEKPAQSFTDYDDAKGWPFYLGGLIQIALGIGILIILAVSYR